MLFLVLHSDGPPTNPEAFVLAEHQLLLLQLSLLNISKLSKPLVQLPSLLTFFHSVPRRLYQTPSIPIIIPILLV